MTQGVAVAELNYEQLQARALDSVERAYAAALDGRQDSADALKAQAQTQALLSVGAAMRDLAKAIREQR
jgi:hypothetical protein